MRNTLDGIRVLDLSRVLAGPWATQLLADFGAEVVKVERPGKGDDTRNWGPPWLSDGEDRQSAYFLSANRNKQSITVDLSSEAGQSLVRELAGQADVIVENFKAGTMDRWGLGPEALRAQHPKLVYCTISAFASESARGQEPGYDAMIQASGGLMSITGPGDPDGGDPQKVGVAIADIMCGMYAASAILAALNERWTSGHGQTIEVPLFDSQVAWLANQSMNYLIGGHVPGRLGTAHPNIVPYQAFPTADGHIMIAVGNDRQFDACARCCGMPELAVDERYRSNPDRLEHRASLIDCLTRVFSTRSTKDWIAALTEAGVPCSPINDIGEVFSSAYAAECELVQYQRHPLDDKLPTVANPVRFSDSEVSYRLPPPMLGQHTGEVLRDWLGYSGSRIDQLKNAGTI